MENFKVSERFAENVFTDEEMKKRLTEEAYAEFRRSIDENVPLSRPLADELASAMKEWAIEKGATHYTHWFQPMTGVTAEKHEAFIEPSKNGVIERFSGKNLIKGEPDASSFPSGGLRATFEARGYTSFDPNSYAFVMGTSLYIPTVFCSYGGESLDKKAPLLRSIDTLNKSAIRILRLLGDNETQKVTANAGIEQEYFLIDKSVYEKRVDLIDCGRTLFGAKPPKGQELEDHYFGKIKARVWDYMNDLDRELWKLGVYAKTKHNEVAPAQHELANVYTTTNLAVDQNQITMSVMKSVANKHGMVCLLNEKPFAGINGSGKHNNWSLSTDSGENLFKPGKKPTENKKFMTFFAAVVAAVDDYQDMLRVSVASPSNDNRLGGNEAPPAIMSIFLGDQLTEVVEKIIDGKASVHATRGVLDLGADTLPKLMQDNTDRNRTSPFAFTGNKFEFRACGSEQNVSDSNLVLDAAVAKSLKSFADALEGTPEDEFQDAALEYCKKVLTDHQRILFSGDGYSDEWPVEAEKRGLANNKTTADALPAFVSDKAIALFEETGVLTKAEAQCRYDCKLEKYNKLMNIEATTMVREARRTYRPVITAYATKVAKGLETIRAAGAEAAMQCEQNTLNKLCNGITAINDSIKALDAVHQKAEALDGQEQANVYAHEVVPAMDTLRAAVDAMEEIVAADYWPVPTYDDILFYV